MFLFVEKSKKLARNLKLFWFYRELLWNLAHREITQRYKQSVLGYAWVIINPLAQLLVMNFVFSTILKVNSLGVPFIIFLSVALLPWNLFTQSLSSSTSALVANSNLITKIYFPREILVYATIIAKIVDYFYSCVVLILLFIMFKTTITIHILWIPVILVIQLIFTMGLSLILATFNLFYRDIQYLLNLILMVWMYLTPIMYPVEMLPEGYRFIFTLNPMAVIINAYRQVMLSGSGPNLNSLGLALAISVGTFLIGFLVFKKFEGEFADYV